MIIINDTSLIEHNNYLFCVFCESNSFYFKNQVFSCFLYHRNGEIMFKCTIIWYWAFHYVNGTYLLVLVNFPVAISMVNEKMAPLSSPAHRIWPVGSKVRAITPPVTLPLPPWRENFMNFTHTHYLFLLK